MVTLSWPTKVFLAVAVPGFRTINAQPESIVSSAASAHVPPTEIQLCDDSVSVCKRKFERIQTVYQYNSTKTEVQWQTSTTVLPVSTYNVTEIVIVTSVEKTVTDGLCDEVHTVTLPGTSIVTVSVNATSTQSIVLRTTATIKTTITHYETASSVCRIQGTLLAVAPQMTLAPMPPPPQQHIEKQDKEEEEGEATDNDADFQGA